MNPGVLVIAACGGSGSGSVSSVLADLGGIRQATGLAPPVETPAAQRTRAAGIVNIDRRAPHPTPVVRFVDVPAGRRGTFGSGLAGNRVQGGFYGPDHVESAGVFEQSDIVGAFGAKRQ